MTSARRLWLKAPAALTGVELACVIGLLLLAAALRLYRLQDYPAGYHNDEVTDAHIIETVVAGRRAIFFPEDTGSEPLYMYWSALFSAALGHTVFALRLPSVFLGMMALCAVWVLTRRLLGPLPAGVALGALGVSWWGVLLSRITLHVAPVAPMLALAVYFFWRGLGTWRVEGGGWSDGSRSTLYFVLSGCFFALAFNSYTAARVTPLLVVALVAYLALVRRDVIRQHWRGLLALAVVALVLAAPLALYLVEHPAAKQLGYSQFDVDQPVTDLLSGKPQLVVETTLQTLGMFGFAGDPLAYYNIPGRPLLEPVGAALFLIGAAALLWRWRDPRYGFVLIGLFFTLLPGMLSQPAPNYARTVGAMAFAFAVPGIGVDVIWRRARARLARRIGAVALAALLLGNVAWTVRDFYFLWPMQSDTRWWMQTGLKEIALALESSAERNPVAACTSSRLIDEYVEWWRPAWWIYHYLSPRTEADVRWYDCAEAVVLPKGTGETAPRFAFPDVNSLAQLDGLPVARWMQSASQETKVGQSLFLRADPMRTWEAEVARLAADSPVEWPPEAGRDQPAALPVDVGHALQLTAYNVEGRAAPGAAITVTTYWRVVAPLESRLTLFTHLITGANVLAQTDHLAITSHSLQPGDVFMQIHILNVPDGLERGWYDLSVGVYSQDTGTRLPVYDGARPVADRLFLRPLRVWRQP
jgi:4-amino-4-deoxy-L-arabinose transferase-like glycosyltransferase